MFIFCRVRLKKIEENTNDILKEHYSRKNNPGKEELLDEKEVEFAEAYKTICWDHFRECFLNNIPEAVSPIPIAPLSIGKKRIFIEVTKDNVILTILNKLIFLKKIYL